MCEIERDLFLEQIQDVLVKQEISCLFYNASGLEQVKNAEFSTPSHPSLLVMFMKEKARIGTLLI